jgi:selenocysteine lyase/cysteine desulfurase
VTVLTPDSWERSSAITTFAIEGLEAQYIQKTLWDQNIITRPMRERNAIRISTSYFCAEENLDTVVDALARIRP